MIFDCLASVININRFRYSHAGLATYDSVGLCFQIGTEVFIIV